jgi:RNA polymerase primary sigma factor
MLPLLPERHRQVVIRGYVLNDQRAQTHHEIGERLGVREERTRQLGREALHRLRSIAEGTKSAPHRAPCWRHIEKRDGMARGELRSTPHA